MKDTSAQAYREAIMVLEKQLEKKDEIIDKLTDKLMSRDFTEYDAVKNPPKDNTEIIKPEDSPYIDPEDVPNQVSDADIGTALRNANTPNS